LLLHADANPHSYKIHLSLSLFPFFFPWLLLPLTSSDYWSGRITEVRITETALYVCNRITSYLSSVLLSSMYFTSVPRPRLELGHALGRLP
jgi:hypothetical protein